MGVRLYHPDTGRFLQPDPVDGGSATTYDYCNADPINTSDIAGTWPNWGAIGNAVKKAAAVVVPIAAVASVIAGPIGMAAAGVSAAAYAVSDNWQQAAIMTAGIALAAVGAGAVAVAAKVAINASRIVRAAEVSTGLGGGIKATRLTTWVAGKMWLGRGAVKKESGRWMSKDGLRQLRSPSYEKKLDKWQANFESRTASKGKMTNNFHVDLRAPRRWMPWW